MKKMMPFYLSLTLFFSACQPAPGPKPETSTPLPSVSPIATASASTAPMEAGSAVSAASMRSGPFLKALEAQGHKFVVECANSEDSNSLVIQTEGLTDEKGTMRVVKIDGKVAQAEVSDLDGDGFPELYVYVFSGESKQGKAFMFISNKGKTLSMAMTVPPFDVAETKDFYAGNDEFILKDSRIVQQFPAVAGDGTPTGKRKMISWRLEPAEPSWTVVVDKVEDVE